MKIVSALLLAVSLAVPAAASDFAGLQSLGASGISKVNPFPEPSNPDSCYLTGLKDGLCRFKCRSGETFQIKPVKPEAPSVYERCGGGDYRGAAETKAVRPQAAAQTYDSYGKYPSAAKASEVLTWAANGFKAAGTEITNQTIVVNGLGDYRFRIAYKAAAPLAIESSPVFRVELDAYERMFDMANRLEDGGATVVTHEVASYEGGYYYVLGYFPGEDDRTSAAAAREMWNALDLVAKLEGADFHSVSAGNDALAAESVSCVDENYTACSMFVNVAGERKLLVTLDAAAKLIRAFYANGFEFDGETGTLYASRVDCVKAGADYSCQLQR